MAFPAHEPTGRSFDAGDYRYKTFSSQSGKEIRILYGDKRTGMKLQLQCHAGSLVAIQNPVLFAGLGRKGLIAVVASVKRTTAGLMSRECHHSSDDPSIVIAPAVSRTSIASWLTPLELTA